MGDQTDDKAGEDGVDWVICQIYIVRNNRGISVKFLNVSSYWKYHDF